MIASSLQEKKKLKILMVTKKNPFNKFTQPRNQLTL